MLLKKKTENYNHSIPCLQQKKKPLRTSNTNREEFLKKLEERSETTSKKLNKKLNKKVSFHLQEPSEIQFAQKKTLRTKKKRKKPNHAKKKNRQNYGANVKKKKKERMEQILKKIREENVVVNLSDEEVPPCTYVFLAKGLGFIPSKKVDIQDLRYDTLEFIRIMKWKAFFHHNPEAQTENTDAQNLHADIKISNFSEAPFQHPVMDELTDRLLGWILNHKGETPKSNLTPLEMRGRKWIEDKIKSKKLFVSKADKGGAILILNYRQVEESIEKEICNERKFEKINTTPDKHLKTVRDKVNTLTKDLQQRQIISNTDKTHHWSDR